MAPGLTTVLVDARFDDARTEVARQPGGKLV